MDDQRGVIERMDRDQIAATYTDLFQKWGFKPVSDFWPPYRYLRLFLPEEKSSAILDAGCGDGSLAFKLAQNGYSNVDAIDLFEEIESKGAFRYQKGSIDALEFADESFDFLYSLSVVFYLDDPRDAFREYLRVLKPGSRLVISAHTKYSLHTLDRVIRRSRGGVPHLRGVRFWSSNAYVRMLKECGFTVLNRWGCHLTYPLRNPLSRARQKFFTKKRPESMGMALRMPSLMQNLVSNVSYHSLIAAEKPLS